MPGSNSEVLVCTALLHFPFGRRTLHEHAAKEIGVARVYRRTYQTIPANALKRTNSAPVRLRRYQSTFMPALLPFRQEAFLF